MAPAHAPSERRPRWGWWVAGGLVLLIIVAVLWVVVRGLIARDQLLGAMPLVEDVKQVATTGRFEELGPLADELAARTATAAALTSDPVWRAMEVVPWAGPNLAAFREAADAIDTVAGDALPPLADLAADLDLASFMPVDGRIDVDAIAALQPQFAEAADAMERAKQTADGIDTAGTIPQIAEAVDQLVDIVGSASGLIEGVNGVVQVLPGMLGADEPRDVLLVMQNNAQLRATGGIPGALALLHTDGGRIEMTEQTSAAALWPYGLDREPAVELTESELGLYGVWLASFGTNATLTPDFARAAEILGAMWEQERGTRVDGAVSVDPIALSYVLEALGPIVLADGTVVDADNAASELLNEVYFRYPDGASQDLFFASAAKTIFDAVLAYSGDPTEFVDAVSRGVSEHRIYVWSADPEEQSVVEASGYLGSLEPREVAGEPQLGVYLADNTSSKADWYVEQSVDVAAVYCPVYDRPWYEVTVTLTNHLPAGGEGIPAYITGVGANGVPPGDVATHVYLTLPTGSLVQTVERGGLNWAWTTGGDDGEFVRVAYTAVSTSGMTDTITFTAFGALGDGADVSVVHTPVAGDFPVTITANATCPEPGSTDEPTDEPIVAAPAGAVVTGR